ALNRCLLLALIYPIATILLIWAVSGHVGPAEAVLGLKPDVSGWSRSFVALAVGVQGIAIWRFFRTKGRKSYAWLAVVLTVAGTLVAGGAVIGAYPFAGFVAIGLALAFGSYFLLCKRLCGRRPWRLHFRPYSHVYFCCRFCLCCCFHFSRRWRRP